MELLTVVEKCRLTKHDDSHEPYCLELFRRAIAEGDQAAWLYIHEQYFRLVYYWITQLSLPENVFVEDLVQDAFFAFWRAYTPEKLILARGLGSVLAYLKDCAISTVIQARRTSKKQIKEEVSWQMVGEQKSAADSLPNKEQIWQRILERCQNEQEQLVAQLTYLSSQKPRQILTQYPDRFKDIQEVYRIQRNLLDRLRRDPILNFMREKRGGEHLLRWEDIA